MDVTSSEDVGGNTSVKDTDKLTYHCFHQELFQWDLKYIRGVFGWVHGELSKFVCSSYGTASLEEVHDELKPKLPWY